MADKNTEKSNFLFKFFILYRKINPVRIIQRANFVINGITKTFAEETRKNEEEIKAINRLTFITLKKTNNIIAGNTRRI